MKDMGSGAECSYPGNKRAPLKLKRSPISAILAHLGEVEEEVERLRSASGVLSLDNNSHSTVTSQTGLGTHRSNTEGPETSRGRLVVCGGRSRYVGNEASVLLGNRIQELREICDNISDDLSMAHVFDTDTVPTTLPSLEIQGSDQAVSYNAGHGRYLYLQPPPIEALWQVYQENVAPMIAILHVPSINAMSSEMPSVFDEDHGACLHEYRVAVEQTLADTSLTGTTDTHVLQAAVLFLLCLRRSAVVVRVAQRQGLHRDGQQLGNSLPTNIDGDHLTPDMPSLPLPRRGYTDITLCITQCEIIPILCRAGKYLGHNTRQQSSSNREVRLSSLANRVEVQYLHDFTLDIPIQWLTTVIVRLTLSKAWLIHCLNTSATHQDPEAAATNDEIFTMGQRHVVASMLFELCMRQITPDTDYTWGVIMQLYDQWVREGMQRDAMLQQPWARLMERAAHWSNQQPDCD
ncbi:hypothetical protein BDW71DRAFT_216520 [Aspergillus fruticulosus]